MIKLKEDNQSLLHLALLGFEGQNNWEVGVERIGMEKGMQKGIEKGLLEEGREMVLEALDERFGQVPDDVSNAVAKIEDRDKLKILHRQAIRCASMDEFRKSLDGQ